MSGRYSGTTSLGQSATVTDIGPQWTLGNELQSLEQTVAELRQSVEEVISASSCAQRNPVGLPPQASGTNVPTTNSPLVHQLESIKYRISDATTLLRQLSSSLQLS